LDLRARGPCDNRLGVFERSDRSTAAGPLDEPAGGFGARVASGKIRGGETR